MSPRIGLNLSMIVQAAIQLADEQGVQAVTLSVLAQQLKVRSPSLYNHIDGLPGLRREMALAGLQQLKETIMMAAVGRAGDLAIREVFRAYLHFVRQHPGLYEATLYVPEQLDEQLEQLSQQILELVRQVLSAYHLTDAQMIHATRGLRSILHGFSSLERSKGFALKEDVDESFEWILNVYVQGLKAMGQSTNA
ncbi:WHG domain-containing protein [Paenibacillus hunanensis]|uniref:TetR/AcrR family transcriptional regulator n=1 Tax=Paenibacillus hunanensis TaxID=539262 RepID=UPI002A6B4193|nr:WHG domain-containing protein [Paenibacillus hunanensis]WPP39412.1 WHG domain-containing protein [Paenibacillus hunanensis]